MKELSDEELLAENERRKERRRRKELAYRPELREGFERWAVECVKVKHKTRGRLVAMRLNRPQRRVVMAMERQRRRGEPIRLIVLKARQWGCSTLVQMYMAWIQLTQAENWHSLVCAHVKDAATQIRGMYSTMLAHYPVGEGEPRYRFQAFEGASNVRTIVPRGCRVTVASSNNPDAARSGDYAMAHLSEVAFWSDTASRTPEQVVSSVCSSVPREPLTLVVMESTANGPGNFFAREWRRAVAGESDKAAVFVPWYELDTYSEPLTDDLTAWRNSLDDYERALWQRGCTLEQINWYHHKRSEYAAHTQMMAEFPTTATEAFSNAARPVFVPAHVDALRRRVCQPLRTGELTADLAFVDTPAGPLKVWEEPDLTRDVYYNKYVVTVDVGGSGAMSDWSVILVTATRCDGSLEVVAQWRGHLPDYEQLAWMAERIARWYGRALLVVESNTLETHRSVEDAAADYVLERLARRRANLYRRRVPGRVASTMESRYGFHTNVQTKGMALMHLMSLLRDGLLVERDADAVDEMRLYQKLPGGGEGAPPGCHDDMVMTRAIAAYVVAEYPPRRRSDF